MTQVTTNILKTALLFASFAMFIAAAQIAQGREIQKETVPVMAASLKRGAVIGASDVMMGAVDARRVSSMTVLDKEDLIGMEATRNLRAGFPVSVHMVRVPSLFKRGATVPVVFQKGGVVLMVEAQALQEGNEGDWVRVKNMQSGRIIRGVVLDNGSVQVN